MQNTALHLHHFSPEMRYLSEKQQTGMSSSLCISAGGTKHLVLRHIRSFKPILNI